MVTVPRPDLIGQFGTTRIMAGTTRRFTLRPRLVWTGRPRSVAADIAVCDSRGVADDVAVGCPWP